MQLIEFSVYGFRSLQQVEKIPVKKPTILAGHNDGGKTAALTALSFLLGSHSLSDDDRTYLTTESSGMRDRAEETVVEGLFRLSPAERDRLKASELLRIRRRAPQSGQTLLEVYGAVPKDVRLRNLDTKLLADLKELASEFGLTPEDQRKSGYLAALVEHVASVEHVDEWSSASSGFTKSLPTMLKFDATASTAEEAVRSALDDHYKKLLTGEEISAEVEILERKLVDGLRDFSKSLKEHVLERCPELVDLSVEPEVSFRGGFGKARLSLFKVAGESVGLDRVGLGQARRVALAMWEWRSGLIEAPDASDEAGEAPDEPKDFIVVYDEPDTHLDYAHQRRIMDLILEQCKLPNVGVLVATHSLNLIDGVDIEDVIHLKLDSDERTCVERLIDDSHDGIDSHLGEIAASLGVRNSVMLHERCFVGVEGATEQQVFPRLFRLSEGIPLQQAGIVVVNCNNNDGALRFAQFLNEHSRAVALVVDADSKTKAGRLFREDKLKQYGLFERARYLGSPNEIEELFGDDLWAMAANTYWPRGDGGTWAASHFAALRSEGKFSKKVEQMIRENGTEGQEIPQGKPDGLYCVVELLTNSDDVPEQLREIFCWLRALANPQ